MAGFSFDSRKWRLKAGIFHLLFYFLIASVFVRMAPHYTTPIHWGALLLMMLYLVLFISEQVLSKKSSLYYHILFTLQLAVILALVFIPSETAPKDYFGNLVLPLSGLAVLNLTGRTANRWVAVLCGFCLISMAAYYRDLDGVSFGLVYITGSLFAAVLIRSTLKAERERAKSEALLAELKSANQKLEEYAHQVQSLAAAEERNRLARELHDSVSQTIFSINLTAESAKLLIDSDPKRVHRLLVHLQKLSQNALSEMRTLIRHLRPGNISEQGLTAAIKSYADERMVQDGLKVNLTIQGERRLPEGTEDAIFRIIQEALNNVVKHAKVEEAFVELDLRGDSISLSISDKGIGFEGVKTEQEKSGYGISSMQERAKAIGGTLSVISKTGGGTIVRVDGIRA